MIFLKNYFINTTAEIDFLPLTADIRYAVRDSTAKNGLVTVIVPGPAVSVVVMEPIAEVIEGLKAAFELFAAENIEGTDKRRQKIGVSPRIQAAMVGRSVSIPLKDLKLALDPYEEVYLIDFDNNPRRREFIVQIIYEEAPSASQPGKVAKKGEIKR